MNSLPDGLAQRAYAFTVTWPSVTFYSEPGPNVNLALESRDRHPHPQLFTTGAVVAQSIDGRAQIHSLPLIECPQR